MKPATAVRCVDRGMRGVEALEVVVEHAREQVLARGEVAIDERARAAGALGDRGQRDGVDAAVLDQVARDADELAAALVGLLVARR